MSIATLVRRLGELGATPEMIALAIEEIEADRACLDARRNAARDRKRAQRERQKSADVTGQVTDMSHDVTPMVSLDKEKSPRPPKEINPFPCVSARKGVKHPLPANWQPTELKPDGQAGRIVAGKPVGWIERQLSKFKDHALQNRRLCADWDAAWRNWIKQADEFDEQKPRNTQQLGKTTAAIAALGGFGDNSPM